MVLKKMLRTLQVGAPNEEAQSVGALAAKRLTVDQRGATSGVALADGELVEGKRVVLADGGFQSNAALRRRFLGPATDRIFLRGARGGNGDCLVMAKERGARLSNTEFFYGHCMHKDALTNEKLGHYPALDDLFLNGAIIVDGRGRRFVDEGGGGIHVANVVAGFEDPLSTFVVMSEAAWDVSAGELIWAHRAPNPELVTRGGVVFSAATVEELAAKIGIDPSGLASTLGTYNQIGETSGRDAPRTGNRPAQRGAFGLPRGAGHLDDHRRRSDRS